MYLTDVSACVNRLNLRVESEIESASGERDLFRCLDQGGRTFINFILINTANDINDSLVITCKHDIKNQDIGGEVSAQNVLENVRLVHDVGLKVRWLHFVFISKLRSRETRPDTHPHLSREGGQGQ